MSIFDEGAAIVPDIVTKAEERRILMRIADAPWLTDLSRRVQHYGYRYAYRKQRLGTGMLPRPRFHDGPPLPWPIACSPLLRRRLCPNSASSTSTAPARASGCTPITLPSAPIVVSLSLAADVDRCTSAPAAVRPYVRHGLASDRTRPAPAPFRSRPERQRTPLAGCMASILPPTCTIGPRRASPPPSAPLRA